MRIALLKKPLLSLFAYEVSCRVRVEKTTLYSAIPEGTASFIHPNNLVPPLLGWIRLILIYHPFLYNTTEVVVFLLVSLMLLIFSILSACFQKPSRNENWLSKLTATIFHLRCYKQSVSRVLFRLRGDNHLSRHGSCLPAQATQPGRFRGPHHPFPIWSCSMWGLPKPASHLTAGALLPHLSTLT